MKKPLLLGLLSTLLIATASAQTPFTNPVLGGDYPDPTIMRDGDDYYMTHSCFDYQPGLVVFHSKDLVHWEPISFALSTYLGSVWAPDICRYEDKYYIYFTVAGPPRSNWVVWADSPYGPWSDPIDLHLGNIDPCHVVSYAVPEGAKGKKAKTPVAQRWLFLSGGRRVKLATDGLSVIPGTEETVYRGWRYPQDWVTEGLNLEGPKLRRVGEYYYYLNAEGGTAGPPTSHMVVQARSKSIDGPWENAPENPLIHTYQATDRWWSKGHGSLIDTPDGRWMIVYHSYENGFANLGRQTLLEEVWLGEDGWFHSHNQPEGDLISPLPPAPLPDRKARLGEFRVGLDWKFYQAYEPERLTIGDRGLTLKAKGSQPGESSPLMFVAGDQRYQVEVEVQLKGNCTAGIVFYYNSQFYMGTGFNRSMRVRYRKGEMRVSGGHPASPDHLWLRLTNDHHVVTGEFSYDGQTWIKESWANEISGYHHNTLYEFQSVLPGLFVCGEGEAVFKNLSYRSW